MNESKANIDSTQWAKWKSSGSVGDMHTAYLRKAESEEIDTHLKGRLEFFSETGTEGGYWAFQDERFITKQKPDYGIWGNQKVFDASIPQRQGITLDDAQVLHGEVWDPLPDPMQLEPDYFKSSLFKGEGLGDKDADKRLMDKYGFNIKYAVDKYDERFGAGNWHYEEGSYFIVVGPDGKRYSFGGTPSTEPQRPYGTKQGELTSATVEWSDGTKELRTSDSLLVESWSYDGLHTLETGDKLTIFDKEDPTKIIWQGEINLSPLTIFEEHTHGLWIHNRQAGENMEEWSIPFLKGNPAELVLGIDSIKTQLQYRKRRKELGI